MYLRAVPAMFNRRRRENVFCFVAGWNIEAGCEDRSQRLSARFYDAWNKKKKNLSLRLPNISPVFSLFLFIAAVSRLNKSAAILARAYFRRARKSEGRRVLKTRGEDEGGREGGREVAWKRRIEGEERMREGEAFFFFTRDQTRKEFSSMCLSFPATRAESYV